MAENMGMFQDSPSGAAQRRKYQKEGTYLALIVRVLQDSPRKMLTFNELMHELEALVSGERKGLENNVRVCLSNNKCFVKVPLRTEKTNVLSTKSNYWRVDESRITEKMVRRHFKGPRQPAAPLTQNRPNVKFSSPAPLTQNMNRPNVKFSSPFSIESLLKTESPTPARKFSHLSVSSPAVRRAFSIESLLKTESPSPGKKFSPLSLSSPPVRAEQQPWRAERGVGNMKRRLSWDCLETRIVHRVADSYSMYNTTGGDTGHGLIGESSIKRMRVVRAESSLDSLRVYII